MPVCDKSSLKWLTLKRSVFSHFQSSLGKFDPEVMIPDVPSVKSRGTYRRVASGRTRHVNDVIKCAVVSPLLQAPRYLSNLIRHLPKNFSRTSATSIVLIVTLKSLSWRSSFNRFFDCVLLIWCLSKIFLHFQISYFRCCHILVHFRPISWYHSFFINSINKILSC